MFGSGFGMGMECCMYNTLLYTVAPRSGTLRLEVSRASGVCVSNGKRFKDDFVVCMIVRPT